ncbi:NADP-dependent oxidoreductase [Calditrichota bacterium]
MNKKLILISRPSGELSPENFKFVDDKIPEPKAREVFLRAKYFSVDPYMRNRMNDINSYIEPFKLNKAMSGDAIAEVVESKSLDLNKGDLVTGHLAWQEYSVKQANKLRKIKTDRKIPVTAHLGILGLTGLTAYFGMLDIGEPKPGETAVISGAAGAVGSIAGQIAKIKGCNVVGIAGYEVKTNYIKNELDFDEAINYKEHSNIRKPLRKACPEGVDIYFDNVGGEISDSVMYMLNKYARIILCGQISLYNQNRIIMGPRLNAQLIIQRVKMQGFIVNDYTNQFEVAQKQLTEWIKQGKIKYSENMVDGFENIVDALQGLFRGENIGKQIVKVK